MEIMLKLTFYGGANEIGGNKILLEDKDAKIYLDFGQSFDFGDEYFYDWLQPRNVNGLEVMFEFDLMPKVEKLYSKKVLHFTDLKYQKSDIDAVFISHSHSDHVNHLPYLDETIPVYMGHGTKVILDAYKKLYKQYYDIGEHQYNLFESGDKIKVKHLIIEPIHVEHSIPGAYGFIIHTTKGPLIYTGDFRLHGPKSQYTKEFIQKAKEAKPYVMLCEGTRMSNDVKENFSEEQVEQKIDKIVNESKGIVFAYFSMSNVDRFFSFYNVAKKSKRTLVIDTRFAYILESLREKINDLPDPKNDKYLKVYFRLGKSKIFDKTDYKVYERAYMPNMITYNQIKEEPKKYLMHMNFFKLMELIYIQPKDSDFIYSSSEHFLEGEENEDQTKVMMNWMKHFGIKFHIAHCSGHIDKESLEHVIKEINPKILIPIHTQNAKDFETLHKNVILPQKNKEIEI